MSRRSPKLYIADILDCIRKIAMYTNGLEFDQFVEDKKTIDAVVRNFTIIGEAVVNVPMK